MLSGRDSTHPSTSPTAPEDQRLIARVAEGDQSALAFLYDRFAPSMLAVAQRILGPGYDVDDLVHDVFLEAWLRARYYDPARGSVRTWLMLRLRSRALDRRRSAQRSKTVELDEVRIESKPSESSPGSAIDASRVRALMTELPAEQSSVLELSYFEGHSCSEIALQLGVPIGTVKSRMSRAIAHLRAGLQWSAEGDT